MTILGHWERGLPKMASFSGQREVLVDDKSDRTVAMACRWRVRQGNVLADDRLQDTQTVQPQPSTATQPAAAWCVSDGDRQAGSFVDIGTGIALRHVGEGMATARHAARTSGLHRRLQH